MWRWLLWPPRGRDSAAHCGWDDVTHLLQTSTDGEPVQPAGYRYGCIGPVSVGKIRPVTGSTYRRVFPTPENTKAERLLIPNSVLEGSVLLLSYITLVEQCPSLPNTAFAFLGIFF